MNINAFKLAHRYRNTAFHLHRFHDMPELACAPFILFSNDGSCFSISKIDLFALQRKTNYIWCVSGHELFAMSQVHLLHRIIPFRGPKH